MTFDYIVSTLNALVCLFIMFRIFYYKREQGAKHNIKAAYLAVTLAFVSFFTAYRWWHGDYNGHADWTEVLFKAIIAFALFRQKGNVAAMFKNWSIEYDCLRTRYEKLKKRFKEKYYGRNIPKMVKRG